MKQNHEKGFLLFNKQDGKGYVVTDSSAVGRLIGVERITIWRWFKDGLNKIEYQDWLIVKDFELIKSTRGKKNKSNQVKSYSAL